MGWTPGDCLFGLNSNLRLLKPDDAFQSGRSARRGKITLPASDAIAVPAYGFCLTRTMLRDAFTKNCSLSNVQMTVRAF